ncbi:nitroreductase family protein [Streptomyces sp. G-G2]|uniref:Acg family FMN-binding oxidoreductase n=1 Tax=Streptomyces sp. G-G2 TaxID=3046201 RepID=UPI0024B9FEB2|nr:nitroreductase family protein [Streptomyces sp. G-G2]MDJ0383552.1 nitroreductase family protein [Streptomyces sp. G-G2]
MSTPILDRVSVNGFVSDAAAAPSMHNAQPWKFRFFARDNSFQVRADPERVMALADPAHRAMHLGCAAALFNLRVAAAHAGWDPVTVLLPDPTDPELLARVGLSGREPSEGHLGGLYPAISRRHTSREPFTDEAVPETVRDMLRNAAADEDAQLVFPDPWHVQSVLDLVDDAEERERADPSVRAETARWARPDAGSSASRTSGIPDHALGPRRWDGRAPVRDFAAGRRVPGRGTATFEQSPQLALLGTPGDGPLDWMRAGQALEHVLLEATVQGLATSLTSHALEWPQLRWAVRDPLSVMGHVQLVLRLGFGPLGTATPRRPVAEILEFQ